MKPVAVARRYARALAEAAAAKSRATLEKVVAEVSETAAAFDKDESLLGFFVDPSIKERDKQQVLDGMARARKVNPLTRSFLGLLIRNRRMIDLPAIARSLETTRDRMLEVVAVETTTAVPLSAAQTARLQETLERMTGRDVRLETRVDPALMGGARTRIGSRVYDGSLQRRLALLRERLASAGP